MFRMFGESGKIDFFEFGGGGGVYRGERIVKRTGIAHATPAGAEGATAGFTVAFEKLDDLENADRGGGAGQPVAAAGAAGALDDAVLGKLGQHLGDEWLRKIAVLRHLGGTEGGALVVYFRQGTDGRDGTAAHFPVS